MAARFYFGVVVSGGELKAFFVVWTVVVEIELIQP